MNNIKQVEFNGMTLWVLEETDLNNFRTVLPNEIKGFQDWRTEGPVKPIHHPITQNAMIVERISQGKTEEFNMI